MRIFASQPFGVFSLKPIEWSFHINQRWSWHSNRTFIHSFHKLLDTYLLSPVKSLILNAIPHLPPHADTTGPQPLKYAVAWLLLSFLISCVIEWMLLSGQLHWNDYFAGHLRPSSAWLNVMDGEEMVMSETLPVLPDLSHSIITVTQFDWAQVELGLSGWLQQNESCWKSAPSPRPHPGSIHLLDWGIKRVHVELAECKQK